MSLFRLRPLVHLSTRVSARCNSSSSSSSLLCPSCSTPLPSNLPACQACSSIFPLPPKISHHKLFAIPDEPNPFVVDLQTLKERYRKGQAACHPDAWASKSSNQQDLAHTLSSRLNEAYNTLLNPLARAEYILQQHGHPLSEHDQAEDLGFMAKIMEAREVIDDAEKEDRMAVEDLVQRNNEEMQQSIEQLKTLIEQKDWSQAKAAAIRLRYQQGIDRAAKKWLDRI